MKRLDLDGLADASREALMFEWREVVGHPPPKHLSRPLMNAHDVLDALHPLLMKHGKPEFIRSDNGPEFISMHLQDWLKRVGIQPLQIYPGSPWENGYNERFNGTLRKEVLNAEWFHTTKQAQVAINAWLRQYNQIRPHHALGMRPPVPETLLEKTKISGTEKWG